MTKAILITIFAIVLTGCHRPASLPRLVEFRDLRDNRDDDMDFLQGEAAAKRRQAWAMSREVRIHLRPGDGALTIEKGNAALGYDVAPTRKNATNYKLTLIVTERGEPLAVEWSVPISPTTYIDRLAMAWPSYVGETNWYPSVWIDGRRSEDLLKNWCEWMRLDTRFELGVLKSSFIVRKRISDKDMSQHTPARGGVPAAHEE